MKKTTKKEKVFNITQDNVEEVISKTKNALIYKAKLKVLGRIYESTGITVEEAISNLKPLNCKGRGILTVEFGDRKKDKILTSVATYRLFNSHGLTRQVQIKNIATLFKSI